MIKLRSFILGMSAALVAPGALAAGFQLNEFGVAAQGRANAGEPAMADSAAAIARNSAAMGNFDKAAISLSYHYIDPKINVKGTNTSAAGPVDANKKGIAPSASVPNFYYVQPLNDQVAVGLSLNSYFGLSTDYGSAFAGSEHAHKTSVKTYYLTPHVSIKPIESLSIGLGISYIYGEGRIKNTASAGAAANISGALGAPGAVAPGTTLMDLDGDGDAFGYTVGLLWNADENTRIGFSYRSAVDLELSGKVSKFVTPANNVELNTPVAGPEVLRSKGKLTLKLPDVYELGVAHDFGKKFTVMAGLQKTGWHRFKALEGDIKGFNQKQHLKTEKWRDAYRFSLGGEWHIVDAFTMRAGWGYDESPVESEYRSLSIPDADRNWWTLGSTVGFGEKGGSLDLAITYLNGKKVKVNEPSDAGTVFNGKLSKTDAFIYSIGYNVSF